MTSSAKQSRAAAPLWIASSLRSSQWRYNGLLKKMLESWHEFYGLLGTAAAALVALLFVAASIGTGYLSTHRNRPTRPFPTPVVFHCTFVLFVSLIALVPIDTDRSLAIVIGISAAGALLYAIFI